MVDPSSFTKLVPGFEFLQGLVQNAGSAVPGIGQWVAPTLNPEELDKRISELRAVQFWLEQNARMLGATIQALEVQRMTLSTLKTMNVQMNDLRDALLIPLPNKQSAAPAAAPKAPARPAPVWPPAPVQVEPAPAPRPAPAPEPEPAPAAVPASAEAPPRPPGGVDPIQWWGALTKQFTELATAAMKDGPAAAQGLAGAVRKAVAEPAPAAPRKTAAKKAARKGAKATPRKRATRAA